MGYSPWGCKEFDTTATKHTSMILVAQTVNSLSPVQETRVRSLGWEDPLEKEMAAQFSILAWKIPWTAEAGSYLPWGRKESDTTEQLHFHFPFFSHLNNLMNSSLNLCQLPSFTN